MGVRSKNVALDHPVGSEGHAHIHPILQERFQYKRREKKQREEFEISNFSPSGHDSGRQCGGGGGGGYGG